MVFDSEKKCEDGRKNHRVTEIEEEIAGGEERRDCREGKTSNDSCINDIFPQ